MEEKELLQQIAIFMQKKYNGLNEIANVTNQLQDALQYNDVVTIRMLIKMRQEEMDEIDRFDRQRGQLMEQLTEAQKKALKDGDFLHFSGDAAPFAEKIGEIAEKNQRLLQKLIEQDRRVNRRLAGEKSYYEKKADGE